MPNPLQLLQDFFKNQAAINVEQRKKWQGAESEPLRQHFNADTKIEDDPNFVDITPKLPWWAADDLMNPKMHVMKPPMSRTQTEVLGGTDFARGVDRLMTDVPELRGRVPRIQHGPTDAVTEELAPHLKPHQYPGTNLAGMYDHQKRDISINPYLDPADDARPEAQFTTTVGHEIGHGMNVQHGPVMDGLHELLKNYVKGRK